jgi:hypothetical protein
MNVHENQSAGLDLGRASNTTRTKSRSIEDSAIRDSNIHDQIFRAANLLFEPGQLVEVRLKGRDGRIASRYFKDHEKMAAVLAKEDASEDWAAAWWTLQQLRPVAHAGKQKGETTKRADVEAYRWIPIDIDRAGKEAKKLNATDGEKEPLLALARKVMAWLAEQGVRDCILADSGNGYHILIKLPLLPANDSNFTLLKEVLQAIKHRFSGDSAVAEIDTSLAEPEQVIKAYGTMTRKSESTLERPWRESKLLDVPETIEPIRKDVLTALAALAPLPERYERKPCGMRSALDPEFDPYDFFDHYSDAFGIEREFEKDGKTYFVTDICILAGHKHTGSGLTGFVIGDTFGYHCFSDDCASQGIRDVLRNLNEKYGPYRKQIWQVADVGIGEEVVEGGSVETIEPAVSAGDGEQERDANDTEASADDELGSNRANNSGEPAGQEVNRTSGSTDQLSLVLAVIFRDPKAAHGDFVIWRNRLQWIVDERAWPKVRRPVLEKLLEYERVHRRLPTRSELEDACGPELASGIGPGDLVVEDIRLDHAVSALLERAEYLDEKRTLTMAAQRLEKQGITEERKFQRERWARGVSVETTHVDGSIQDHADEIFDRMAAMGSGASDRSPLSFATPFPSINEAILSDQERCFAVIGPPNNFKTSVLLSQAYFLAKQGKPALVVTGEHEVGQLEEKITLLHGFFYREKFALPPYKKWADGQASQADVANLRAVMDDWKSLRGVPGSLVVKHIQDFGHDLDRIVAWMESTHRKYGWKALIIDPFMELLLNVDDKEKFNAGGSLCQKLLALKTGYRNGEGLIVATSLQMKKAVKGKAAGLSRNPDTTLADYELLLEASEIERYSGAVQRFDMLWGVAQADERGRRGVIVCSRMRHGSGFEPFYFHVDPASHFCFEQQRKPDVDVDKLIEAIE